MIDYIFQAIPFALAAVLSVLAVVYIGLSIRNPALIAYPLLLLILTTSGISYGAYTSGPSIYSRGAGQLYIPLLMWVSIIGLIWIYFGKLFQPRRIKIGVVQLDYWMFGWIALVMGHTIFALVSGEKIQDATSPTGLVNFAWMAIIYQIVKVSFTNRREIERLQTFILVVAASRAVYGLIRFIGFGGDPTNAYANRHGINIKLSFFDVFDSMVCMLAVALTLTIMGQRNKTTTNSKLRSLLYIAIAGVATTCIILSFRRTATIGLVLGGIFLFGHLTRKLKIGAIALGLPLLVMAIAYTAYSRLSQTTGAIGLGDFLFDITPRAIGPESERLLELKLGLYTFLAHPIFGVGSWGSFEGWRQISWQSYEGSAGTFLHSGILHVAYKAGAVGLLLLFGLIYSIYSTWQSGRLTISPKKLPLAVAGISALLFAIPDFLISTAVPNSRAMLLIGICLAIVHLATTPDSQDAENAKKKQ